MQTRSKAPFQSGPYTFYDLRNRYGLEVKISQNHGETRWRPMAKAQEPQILHLLEPSSDLRLQTLAAAHVLLEMSKQS